jgi:selT/selW/selH-like putative selenoprotein
VRLGEVLRQHFGVESVLIAGRGGVFDVVVDGKQIFSKHKVDRFPDADEIVRLIEGGVQSGA